MSFSRVLLALVVVFACSLSLIAAQGDPLTHCSPVTVDTFQVVTGASGDAPGAVLSIVNGTYPIQQYTVMLTSPYVGSSVFFTVALTPNSTINTPGTVGVQFTIALNGLLKTNSNGSPQIFNPNPLTGLATVEFTNWKGYLMSFTITNVLMLNVTETITVGQDVTTCSYVYTITMITPGTLTTGAFVTGDPQFVGLRGQSFQVHGVDGAVYNIISDASMQLNSRFTFLEGPRPCPVMPSSGKLSSACWSHPGSYLSELALKTIGGSKLLIVSGDAATGFASVTLNGKTIKAGGSAKLDFGSTGLTGSISVDNSHELTIKAGHFNLIIENNDGFVNLRQVSVPSSSWSKLASHGLLGQTYQNKRYSGKIKEIEGDVDDYLVDDDDMFGDVFLYNRFNN